MARPDDRRAMIRHKAAELFAVKGVAATTVREIGDAVGILSGSLYHHFRSKDAIVEEIIHDYVHDLLERYATVTAAEADPSLRLAALIRTSFRSLADYPEACEIYQNDFKYLRTMPALDDLDRLVRDIQRTWIETIAEGIDTGAFRPDLDPVICYRFLRDSIWFTVRWYRSAKMHERQYDIDDIGDKCIALFMHGFESDGARSATSSAAAPARAAATLTPDAGSSS